MSYGFELDRARLEMIKLDWSQDKWEWSVKSANRILRDFGFAGGEDARRVALKFGRFEDRRS